MSEPFVLGTIKAALGLTGANKKLGIMLDEEPAVILNEIAQKNDDYSKSEWEKAQRLACGELVALGKVKRELLEGDVGRFIDLIGRLRNVTVVNDGGADDTENFRAEVDELWQLKDMTSEFAFLSSGTLGYLEDFLDGSNKDAKTFLVSAGAMFYGAASTKAALAEAKRLREAAPYVTVPCALIIKRARAFRKLLEKVDSHEFKQLINKLEKAVNSDVNYGRYGQKEKEIVAVSCGIVREVKTILDTPLLTEDGKVTDESELIVQRVTPNLNSLFSRAKSIS